MLPLSLKASQVPPRNTSWGTPWVAIRPMAYSTGIPSPTRGVPLKGITQQCTSTIWSGLEPGFGLGLELGACHGKIVPEGFPWSASIEAHGMRHGSICPIYGIVRGLHYRTRHGMPVGTHHPWHTPWGHSIGCNHGDPRGTPWDLLLCGTCHGVRHGSICRMVIVVHGIRHCTRHRIPRITDQRWDTPWSTPQEFSWGASMEARGMYHGSSCPLHVERAMGYPV